MPPSSRFGVRPRAARWSSSGRNANWPFQSTTTGSTGTAARSTFDSHHLRIIEGLGGHHGRIPPARYFHLPLAAGEVCLIDGHFGLDHDQSDGPSQSVAVGSRAHIPDAHTV